LAAYLTLDGRFTIGMFIAFHGFLSPVNGLTYVMQSFQEMRGQMERVEDVVSYKPDVEFNTNNEEDIQMEDCQKLIRGDLLEKHKLIAHKRI